MLRPLTDTDPTVIGPYHLQNRIGVGGMGIVYLGIDDEGRAAAVKMPHEANADDHEFRARFRAEVTAARRVVADSVAQVVDADVQSQRPWLATEYVQGPTLNQAVVEEGPIAGRPLNDLATGLADALRAIHAQGVIHRDLKPANIVMSWRCPKVIDFGVARHPDYTGYTRLGELVGTVAWMSPEQVNGQVASPASDVFAWACCIVFAATGRSPFSGDTREIVALRITTADPDLTGIPVHLLDVVRRSLSRNPSDRPTAAELADLLGAPPQPPTTAADRRPPTDHPGPGQHAQSATFTSSTGNRPGTDSGTGDSDSDDLTRVMSPLRREDKPPVTEPPGRSWPSAGPRSTSSTAAPPQPAAPPPAASWPGTPPPGPSWPGATPPHPSWPGSTPPHLSWPGAAPPHLSWPGATPPHVSSPRTPPTGAGGHGASWGAPPGALPPTTAGRPDGGGRAAGSGLLALLLVIGLAGAGAMWAAGTEHGPRPIVDVVAAVLMGVAVAHLLFPSRKPAHVAITSVAAFVGGGGGVLISRAGDVDEPRQVLLAAAGALIVAIAFAAFLRSNQPDAPPQPDSTGQPYPHGPSDPPPRSDGGGRDGGPEPLAHQVR